MKTGTKEIDLHSSWHICIFFLSAATLTFEINLTRLFSVSQFYHFAFMIVSLALLGFGASGSILSIFPQIKTKSINQNLILFSLGTGLSIIIAYMLINVIPFDSFSIAWDIKQVFILVLHYLVLASPFTFAGLAVGLLLAVYPDRAGKIYSVNLIGSGYGCLFALIIPSLFSGEGTVTFSCLLAIIASLSIIIQSKIKQTPKRYVLSFLFAILGGMFCLTDLSLRCMGSARLLLPDIKISPYKGLSYALQYPEADLVFQEWNAVSRVDLVESPGIRSLTGLSYRYTGQLPPEKGLFVDGDDLTPVIKKDNTLTFSEYMPSSIIYELIPNAETLILEPKGGLDIVVASNSGTKSITAVEPNTLIIEAARDVYQRSGVNVEVETGRSYLHRADEKFDIIIIALTNAYHPIRSGAYSLGEDYRYTVETITDTLNHLKPGGMLLFTRWLQSPPSEYLRAFVTTITAMETIGFNPDEQLIAFRGYNTGTLIAKANPFTTSEINAVKKFTKDRAFDMVFAPGLEESEVNIYNRLDEALYYRTFNSLLSSPDRKAWYKNYEYDILPPTDNHPFFGHYFRWTQAPQIVAELGKTWQPFGGAGYFVLLVFLFIVVVIAALLILLPLIVLLRPSRLSNKADTKEKHQQKASLVYFGMIGLAFLLVEIPLIQKFILYLGQPAYAVTVVIFALLAFSSIGSRNAHRLPHQPVMLVLIFLIILFPYLLDILFNHTLGFALPVRVMISVLSLAPLGLLMGFPFPAAILKIKKDIPEWIPWVWGVNGAASVVSSVIAALLALSFGFQWVLYNGAFCYLVALLMVPRLNKRETILRRL